MNKQIRLSLAILGLVVIWFASGLLKNPEPGSDQSEPTGQNTLTRVKSIQLTASEYRGTLNARGRSEPNRRVVLRAELQGRVTGVGAQKGYPLAAGTSVCQIAEDDRRQWLMQADAAVKEAELDYQGALKLQKSGLQSEVAIARALAQLESARAQRAQRRVQVENLSIRMPFDGILEERPVEIGDYLQPGQVCGEVVELDPLKVVAQLAETEVGEIRMGDPAEVAFVAGAGVGDSGINGRRIKGRSIAGTVTYIASTSEPSTRFFTLEVQIPNPGNKIRAGLTGTITLKRQARLAHQLPASLLSLDDDGQLGVKIISRESRVEFLPVSVLGDDGQGVWVSGLPAAVHLISVGHEYVAAGEVVEAVDVAAADSGILRR